MSDNLKTAKKWNKNYTKILKKLTEFSKIIFNLISNCEKLYQIQRHADLR